MGHQILGHIGGAVEAVLLVGGLLSDEAGLLWRNGETGRDQPHGVRDLRPQYLFFNGGLLNLSL